MGHKVYFDGSGFEAERLAQRQFGGELVEDLELQYKDIDLIATGQSGRELLVSVKDQYGSSKKYGSIQVETWNYDTVLEEGTEGWLPKGECNLYLWRVYTEEMGDTWLMIERNVLLSYIEENKYKLREWQTTRRTEALNRSYGRKYDRMGGYVLNIDEVASRGVLMPLRRSVRRKDG